MKEGEIMLTVEAARRRGINACIDKLGCVFVLAHRETSSASYAVEPDENGDVFCFVIVTYLLCKDDPFEYDKKKEDKIKNDIEKQLSDKYRKFLEKNYPLAEIDSEMEIAKEMLSRKATAMAMAKQLEPTFIEKMSDRFDDAMKRWLVYVTVSYIVIFGIVAFVIVKNS